MCVILVTKILNINWEHFAYTYARSFCHPLSTRWSWRRPPVGLEESMNQALSNRPRSNSPVVLIFIIWTEKIHRLSHRTAEYNVPLYGYVLCSVTGSWFLYFRSVQHSAPCASAIFTWPSIRGWQKLIEKLDIFYLRFKILSASEVTCSHSNKVKYTVL